MTVNTLDLIELLELPNDRFIPAAFRAIIGRESDIIGLMHYARRLHVGLPRTLVLAELRHSPEGQAHAGHAVSDELDKLESRYLAVRSLPFKNLRWKLLPKTRARIPSEPTFHWERWANDYVVQMNARAAQQALNAAQTAAVAQPMHSAEPENLKLQSKLDTLTAALRTAASAMQGKGVPDHVVQGLHAASKALQPAPLDMASVPWEGRQALHWLAQGLRY
jgi:hypothetical protein